MKYLFYRSDAGEQETPRSTLPQGATIRTWSPSTDGLPARGQWRFRNFLWWAVTRLGLFARRDLTEVTLWRDGHLLHRLIVTPRWFRFPFMAAGDLQLGDLWTDPNARGEGLAKAAIGFVHDRLSGVTERFWYVVAEDNRASVRLIESCGYRLVGEGVRTAPLGIVAIGRFRLESQAP